jgi:hypothetical protein
MNIDDIIGKPQALRYFVRDLSTVPDWAWLYTKVYADFGLSTPCRMTLVPSREISDEEADARDEFLEQEGFVCLFFKEQIESVIANLQYRHPSPTDQQIEEALSYYLAHDAFIIT